MSKYQSQHLAVYDGPRGNVYPTILLDAGRYTVQSRLYFFASEAKPLEFFAFLYLDQKVADQRMLDLEPDNHGSIQANVVFDSKLTLITPSRITLQTHVVGPESGAWYVGIPDYTRRIVAKMEQTND